MLGICSAVAESAAMYAQKGNSICFLNLFSLNLKRFDNSDRKIFDTFFFSTFPTAEK